MADSPQSFLHPAYEINNTHLGATGLSREVPFSDSSSSLETSGQRKRLCSSDCADPPNSSIDDRVSTSDESNKSVPLVPLVPSVRFDSVTIREYDVMLGDSPACSNGCPLSLDWGYSPIHIEHSIDEYEFCRASRRRCAEEMKMSAYTRYNKLINEWNVPLSSIQAVSEEIEIIRKARNKCLRKYRKQQYNKEKRKEIWNSIKAVLTRGKRHQKQTTTNVTSRLTDVSLQNNLGLS